MTVHRAGPEDAAAIHALMVAAFTPFQDQYTDGCFDATVLDPVRIRTRMEEGPVWVASAGDSVVGTVGARRDDRGLYIRGMAVHPQAQRQGIGHALLAEVEDHARHHGIDVLWLSTTTFLTASQALYEAAGFRRADGPPDLFGTPLVSFEKRL